MAISPIERRYAARMAEKLGLDFPLLRDPGNRVASGFRLTVSMPEPLREVYRGFGIDLERVNGEADWTVPLASRYVIAPDGIIADARIHVDHTRRPEPEETLEVLRRLERGE